jgi:hypothetical protein
MKDNVIKANKSAVRKQKKGASSETTVTTVKRRKIKQTLAEQVDAFIERYRPAIEALAKQ